MSPLTFLELYFVTCKKIIPLKIFYLSCPQIQFPSHGSDLASYPIPRTINADKPYADVYQRLQRHPVHKNKAPVTDLVKSIKRKRLIGRASIIGRLIFVLLRMLLVKFLPKL